jgi:hypothetical protein
MKPTTFSRHVGIAILTAGFIAVVGAQPRTQSPSDFKYYFPSGPAADDASEHYTQLGDGNPCGLQAQATLDIVNKSRDKTLRVHLNRTFYLVIDATTARALREPPRGARARYVQDFEIPPKTTQHVGCTKWFDAKNDIPYLIAYSAEIHFGPIHFEYLAPKPPAQPGIPRAIPPAFPEPAPPPPPPPPDKSTGKAN